MSSLTSGFTIWLSKGCACLLSSIAVISEMSLSGSSTSALASSSGRSRTIDTSISPPSFLMSSCRPSWAWCRMEKAWFSQIHLSHSSAALSDCRAASAKSYRQSGGDQSTPGRTSDPCRAASAAPAMQKPAESKGRQGVHPTPCRAPNAAPAAQKPPAEQRRPRDAFFSVQRQMALARSFIKPERQLHCANSPN